VLLSATFVAAPSVTEPAAAATGSATYTYTGGPQYFTVPANTHEVLIEAWGAQGGGNGGRGGYVRGLLPVTPGEGLQVNVGGQGVTGGGGGWNGGGNRGGGTWTPPSGGGGASDVRQGGPSRMIVAGGGGGNAHSEGGEGGYPEGTKAGDNGMNSTEQGGEGGYGGTQSAGGWGGYGFCGSGWAGFAGQGGNGGYSSGFAGGGGGGGYYGGGGGGSGCNWGGTGGGGGSSFASVLVTAVVYDTGTRSGNGMIRIAWTVDAMAANISATETAPDGVNNTGESVVPIGPDAPYVDIGVTPEHVAFKLAAESAIEARVPSELAHHLNPTTEATPYCFPYLIFGPGGTATSCPPGTAPSGDPATGQVALLLHPQETDHTCGPASVRSLVHTMVNQNLPEAQLAHEMEVDKYGEVHDYRVVAKALNNHQSRDGFFGDPDPDMNPNRLMAQMIHSVQSDHPMVLNVDQSKLNYWHRTKKGWHYLPAFGYSLREGGTLYLGDVAPKVSGAHEVPLSEATTAVISNKGLTVR
jgi:hypothetical protein